MKRADHTQESERASLAWVVTLREELAIALDSLQGRDFDMIKRFVGFSARQMNRAAEGYILLRQAGRIDCSKLLVRPAIEIMFRLRVVQLQPRIFYRMALTERKGRDTWLGLAARKLGGEYDGSRGWDQFKQYCVAQIPGLDQQEKIIRLSNIAEEVGMKEYYDSHYRMYCKFTHSALEAVNGDLDAMSDPEDNRTMGLCVFAAIEALLPIGAVALNIEPLRQGLQGKLDEITARQRVAGGA